MMKSNRASLGLFFVLAFLLPWIVWGTTIAQNRGILSFHIPQSLAFWVGLTVATFGTAALSGGTDALKDLLLRMVRVAVHPVWYIAALLLMPALAGIAIAVGAVSGTTYEFPARVTIGGVAGTLLFQWFFFLVTEETAWRGFALPRLQKRLSAGSAALLLGVIWGLWHLPLVFVAESFQSQIPFFGFLLAAVAMSVLTSFIFNNSRGSVFVAALFHAATDTTIGLSAVMTSGTTLFWIFVIVLLVAALLVWLVAGAKTLARGRDIAAARYCGAGSGLRLTGGTRTTAGSTASSSSAMR